ncbi:ribokinase [Micromonospora haikouensis]|uniref:Ribokinase n=1 Tax=Micromonospora haikouensis TaxID=686309 RepID=A0A1C4XDL6_9ACTN|nr:PfkB family carbohydrate kinase [Micromonospora haikouensis]SCF06559.1 ribokinase [Micromonospora haikouensis]
MTDSPLPPGGSSEYRSALRRAANGSRVLVVGSLNVDLIVQSDREPDDDGAVVVPSIVTAPGGHAGNCASALAALGIRVDVAAAIGTDPEGDSVLSDLRSRDIGVSAVHRYTSAPTGRVIIPVFSEKHYMLMHRGANDLLSAAKVRDALTAPIDAVVMFDPSREALRETVETVARQPRPPLLCWCPGGIYCGDDIVAEIAPHCDVLLLNRDEHRQITGRLGSASPGRPGGDVVLTLGREGSLLRRGDQEWHAPAEPVQAVDPTGAGDAFAAAYLLSVLAGLPPLMRLRSGNVGGAVAVSAVGARARHASLAELTTGVAPDPRTVPAATIATDARHQFKERRKETL